MIVTHLIFRGDRKATEPTHHYVLPDHTSWVTRHDASWRNIAENHSARAYDALIAYVYTRQDDRTTSDKAIATDANWCNPTIRCFRYYEGLEGY